MDIDKFHSLPEWDDFKRFRNEEPGEDWKNDPRYQSAKNLYNQAREVYKYATIFSETLKGEMAESTKELILQNALMLAPKIIGAEGGDIYIIRMENASIIRTNAIELETQVKAAHLYEQCSKADKDIVITELEKFKALFKTWVSFFQKDDIVDDWGLY